MIVSKKIFFSSVCALVLLIISGRVHAKKSTLAPAVMKTSGTCVMSDPAKNIRAHASARRGPCYVYVPFDVPDGSVVSAAHVFYHAVDANCLLEASLRISEFNPPYESNTVVSSQNFSGLTNGVEDVALTGVLVDENNAYYLRLVLWYGDRCFVSGVQIEY